MYFVPSPNTILSSIERVGASCPIERTASAHDSPIASSVSCSFKPVVDDMLIAARLASMCLAAASLKSRCYPLACASRPWTCRVRVF